MITISYNYSTNDIEFLQEAIEQAKIVTDDIHFSYVNKFFDGTPEDEYLLSKTKEIASSVNIHELDFVDLSEKLQDRNSRFKYWHNLSRISNAMNSKYDYILFLDGDEILDGVEFKKWLSTFDINEYSSYSFDVFWYFRDKKYQATAFEEGPVMSNKNNLTNQDLMNITERWALLKNPSKRRNLALNSKPMIHHFSWAKGNCDEECKEKLLKKVKSWGHSSDRDWQGQINEEFSRPFNGKDFVHGYNYNILS